MILDVVVTDILHRNVISSTPHHWHFGSHWYSLSQCCIEYTSSLTFRKSLILFIHYQVVSSLTRKPRWIQIELAGVNPTIIHSWWSREECF